MALGKAAGNKAARMATAGKAALHGDGWGDGDLKAAGARQLEWQRLGRR
jgi:hypothetical protein